MDLLYKHGEYIVDVEECKIYHTDHKTSFTFNFETWQVVIGSQKSLPKPVRYDADNDKLLYWGSKQWNRWSEQKCEVIKHLFHTWQEWKLVQ